MIKAGVIQEQKRTHLFCYSIGLFLDRRIRKILKAHGFDLKTGIPNKNADAVSVWGYKPVSKRGRAIAKFFKKDVITLEDAFLRSVLTGRQGGKPMGLVVDRQGIYFDTGCPSDLDIFLNQSLNLNQSELLFAQSQMEQMCRLHISKYNDFTSAAYIPDDFVLIVDQTLNDASIQYGQANANTFSEMLKCAKREHPNRKIIIKPHPETSAGNRKGYFSEKDCDDQVEILTENIAPAALFKKVSHIYCVTSQLGLEAIFAGHRPIVFGCPFYSGLGLSEDRLPRDDKKPTLTPAHLFWATHLKYPKWYNPFFDRAANFDEILHILQAKARQHRDNRQQTFCFGMRLWKRGFLKKFLSSKKNTPRFIQNVSQLPQTLKLSNGHIMVWASQETQDLKQFCGISNIPLTRVEDGFLRSVGLGAALMAPVSLVFDDQGMYYDPIHPSRLEQLITESVHLPEYSLHRTQKILDRIIDLKMTKYNLPRQSVRLSLPTDKEIILVPGQVEDDASILKGAYMIRTNLALLKAVRSDFSDAVILYKPHPDVEAGLRVGAIAEKDAMAFANHIVLHGNIADVLERVDRVATLTSLTGFEALIRKKTVTCYGQPFYSGWGLTDDKAPELSRRKARPSLVALAHACLIDYPRYWDPVTHEPCPIEVILERFERGEMTGHNSAVNRMLSKMQGIFASYAHIWR